METLKRYDKLIVLGFLVFVTVVIWYALFYFENHRDLRVTFFDVGQGDAIFVEVPNGNQILIDGGPGNAILSKLGQTLPFWDRSLDLLILTHPHADHLDGLLEVLKRYRVGMVLESGVAHSISEYREWQARLKNTSTPSVRAKAGQRVSFGQNVLLDILSPFEDFTGRTVDNPHEATIVSRLTHGKTSILLMGDAERPLEYRILFEYPPEALDADILKVGHHGSRTSSSDEFLKVVSPDSAVIQVGRRNRYGHPTQEVLARLAAMGAAIRRNDQEGDIRITSSGSGYRVEAE